MNAGRFGTQRVYYVNNGKGPALGPSFYEVAKQAPTHKLDWLGIGGFLRFGFFPDDRTYYEDIRILKPAANWEYRPNYKRSYEQTVDEFAGIFHDIIKEQTAEGRIAVPISGGLDSRSTVAALQNIGEDPRRFWAYSYGYSEDSVEIKIAREIARAAGFSFNSYVIKPYLFDELPSIVETVEGFQDVTQARQAFVKNEIKKNADSVICAHWGDVWMDSMLKENGTTDLTETVFKKFCKNGSETLLRLFEKQLPLNLDVTLKDMVRKKLKDYEGIENDDFKMKAFKTDWWSFRWTLASIRMFAAAAKPLLPFYDERMAEFFMTVPTEYVAGRKLQIDYLKKYAPGLAKVKWQAYDANLYDYRNFSAGRLFERLFKKTQRVLLRKKVYQRNWEIQFEGEAGLKGLHDWLVRPGLKIHEFISPQALTSEIARLQRNPDAAQGYALSMLVTLSAALQRLA